jgi:cephalosporin hydroxylase
MGRPNETGVRSRAMAKLPPRVPLEWDGSLRDYFRERIVNCRRDRYAGVRLAKLSEDLRLYEHLLWISKPNVVIEVGISRGGSVLWFRDRLRTLASYGHVKKPRVIGIDVEIDEAHENLAAVDPTFEQTIKLVEANVTDPALPDRVAPLIPRGSRCLVIDDSAHVYETTTASLAGLARFVPPQGFFVVEDGYVDMEELRFDDELPRGVLPAIHDWLETGEGRAFRVRRDLEVYGITGNPGGVLQRAREAREPPP